MTNDNSRRPTISNTSKPDYTITIIERDGFSIVCAGGVEISKPMDRQAHHKSSNVQG